MRLSITKGFHQVKQTFIYVLHAHYCRCVETPSGALLWLRRHGLVRARPSDHRLLAFPSLLLLMAKHHEDTTVLGLIQSLRSSIVGY